MELKVIRSDEQYRAYLGELQNLISMAPSNGSEESDRVELLSVLIESYETDKYPVEAPDPIDAISFRMQEAGLKQADLVPYLGTRSRVSEILSRKRPLTVPMIRALSIGLGISADTLIGAATQHKEASEIDWSQFPAKELVARGWINQAAKAPKASIREMVRAFIAETMPEFGTPAFKRTIGGEAYTPTTKMSLLSWMCAVIHRARERRKEIPEYKSGSIDANFLGELAQLSWFDRGPVLAVEFLEKHGIAVIFEPHLKGTLLDGAALKDKGGEPIIALTLRHDRLDNFWFTLMHEVVHLWKHVDSDQVFFDDLDVDTEDRREAEANRLARETFIPRLAWKHSAAHQSGSKESVIELSRELKIHPAIVAGRVRRETGNYQLLSDMVGAGVVREMFAGT